MVEQLAKDRNPKAIAELEQIVERESRLKPGSEAVDQLTDFHAAVARLSGNATLQILSAMLHHIIEKANRSLQPTKGDRAEQAVRRSAKTHRMVLEMIKAGDAEKGGPALETAPAEGGGVRPYGRRNVHCRRSSRMTG